MKSLSLIILLLFATISLFGIVVGGHITEDTLWSPSGGPYEITSFLYIDAGVTLTILPGTQVLCQGVSKDSYSGFDWNGTNEPACKMIVVYGRIEAVGTPDDPIVFDKLQNEDIRRWGGIYMAPQAPSSTFEYCIFRYALKCEVAMGIYSRGALSLNNVNRIIQNCRFEHCNSGIWTKSLISDLIIYKCTFIDGGLYLAAAAEPIPDTNYQVLVADCVFEGPGPGTGNYTDLLILNSSFTSYESPEEDEQRYLNSRFSHSTYGNTCYVNGFGLACFSATESDIAYSRRNTIFTTLITNMPSEMSANGYGTNYVSDNYLHGRVMICVDDFHASTNYIYNNIIESKNSVTAYFEKHTSAPDGAQIFFFNNLLRFIGTGNCPAIYSRKVSPKIYNNTIVGYPILFTLSQASAIFENNILGFSDYFGSSNSGSTPLYYNNCLGLPIPEHLSMYGEGNIVSEPVFADTLNLDYSLGEDSPCIDAGILRPYLTGFDLQYHQRISTNGPRKVDIGAYEYDSVYIGGIEAFIYDSTTGLAVDCVKVEINGKLPEFSDLEGNFTYPCGAGIHNLKLSRWDYEEQIIPNIQVNLGEVTELNIALSPQPSANVDWNYNSPAASFILRNYPNPFNPSTTIQYNLPEAANVRLEIYNIKGQLVKTMVDSEMPTGMHSIVWNGKDMNNRVVPSGIYFYRISSPQNTQTKRMLLMK